ncbi:hypothetical protein KIW84_044367, partial [Lathyrus oleraceus]
STFTLTPMQKLQAHRYLLLNCEVVTPFIEEFRQFIKRSSRSRRLSATEIEKRLVKEFADWFKKRILNPETLSTMSTDLKILARGPLTVQEDLVLITSMVSNFEPWLEK